VVSIASVLTLGNYSEKVKPRCLDRLPDEGLGAFRLGVTSLPNVLEDHNAPESVRILFPRWVRQADASDNGTIEILTRAEPNPRTRKPYSHATVDRAIAWLTKHRLMVPVTRGRGRGHHPRFRVRWSFEHGSLRDRQYARNHDKLENGQSHTIEENHDTPLIRDQNNGASSAADPRFWHLWQPTVAWRAAVTCHTRKLLAVQFERSPSRFISLVADAVVHHLAAEVLAARLGPGAPFDRAIAAIVAKCWETDSLLGLLAEPGRDAGAAAWHKRDIFAAVGGLVRCWREERLQQAEVWRKSARKHWEDQEYRRECERDPLDFDVVATIRAETRRRKPEPPDPEPEAHDTPPPESVPEQEEHEFVSVRQLMSDLRTASESVHERPRKKSEKRPNRRDSEWCRMIDEFRKQKREHESASVDHGDAESGDCRGNKAITRGDFGQ